MTAELPIADDFPPSLCVAGKHVAITGSAGGLGRVLAVAFARAGATVGLVGRNEDALRKVALSLPGEHLVLAGDVRDQDFSERVAQAMVDECGSLDVFVGNAGISPILTPVMTTDPRRWDQIISTNLTGCFLGARASAKVMAAGGRIIFTSSVIGQRSRTGLAAYAASKSGLDALTRTLALELGPRDITVNAVAPGWFDSSMSAGFRMELAAEAGVLGHTAMGRWGTADDLPGPYLFLASDAARFVTGTVIAVDGGYLLV